MRPGRRACVRVRVSVWGRVSGSRAHTHALWRRLAGGRCRAPARPPGWPFPRGSRGRRAVQRREAVQPATAGSNALDIPCPDTVTTCLTQSPDTLNSEVKGQDLSPQLERELAQVNLASSTSGFHGCLEDFLTVKVKASPISDATHGVHLESQGQAAEFREQEAIPCMGHAELSSIPNGQQVLSQDKSKELWNQRVMSVGEFALANGAELCVKGLSYPERPQSGQRWRKPCLVSSLNSKDQLPGTQSGQPNLRFFIRTCGDVPVQGRLFKDSGWYSFILGEVNF